MILTYTNFRLPLSLHTHTTINHSPILVRRYPPPPGTFKLNFDGSCKTLSATVRFIIRNNSGASISAHTHNLGITYTSVRGRSLCSSQRSSRRKTPQHQASTYWRRQFDGHQYGKKQFGKSRRSFKSSFKISRIFSSSSTIGTFSTSAEKLT